MKALKSLFLAVAGLLALASAGHAQQQVSYSAGDLLMGFHATGTTAAQNTTGTTETYLMNLGPITQFIGQTNAFQVNVSGVAADLSGKYGANWHTRDDMYWGAVATSNTGALGEAARTLFATKAQAVVGTFNAPEARWPRNTTSAQATPSNKIQPMGSQGYALVAGTGTPNTSTANNVKGIFQQVAYDRSWASYQPGGPSVNVGVGGGISFAYFDPSVEGFSATGIVNTALELYRVVPVANSGDIGTPSELLGVFTINSGGAITFTPFNDTTSARVSVASQTVTVNDTDATATIQLTRTTNTTDPVTVYVSTTSGSAAAGTDFTALSGQAVNFGANESTASVNVTIKNAAAYRGNVNFTVSLVSAGAGALIVDPKAATVTITETDAQVSLSSATYSVVEDAGNVHLTLNRTGRLSDTVSVLLNTADGGGSGGVSAALTGSDYAGQTNVPVSFAPNELTRTFDIPVENRPLVQGQRAFTVTIAGNGNGAAVSTPSSAVVTISDNGVPGVLAFSSAAGNFEPYDSQHAANLISIPVQRTGGTDGAVAVGVTVSGGSLVNGTDFNNIPAGTAVSFANGVNQSSVNIQLKEPPKSGTIELTLATPTGGATLGAQATFTVTVVAADTKKPTLVVTGPKAGKLPTGTTTFTVAGSAKDDRGISRVEVTVNGESVVANLGTFTAGEATFTTAALNAENGSNTIVITAVDTNGNRSASTTRVVTYANTRATLAGAYNGLVLNATATDLLNRNGLISLKVTATGTFTGKVTIAGASLPVSGIFLNDGTASFKVGKTYTPTLDLVKKAKPTPIALGGLKLSIDLATDYQVTGSIVGAGPTLFADITADLAVYTSKKNPVAPLRAVPTDLLDPTKEKGKYTSLFVPGTTGAGTPSGYGYGTITISAAGVAKIVGKLADGSSISYSNALSKDKKWPLFIPLYGKQGFIAAEVQFDATALTTDATASTLWFKPANLPKQTYFAAGWPTGLTPGFKASKYFVPTAPSAKNPTPVNQNTALGAGTPAGTALEIDLKDGALGTPLNANATIDAKSKVTVSTATNGVKVSFVASSGALSGSFTHTGNSKTVKFSGLAFQKDSTAGGFFQYKASPADAGETGSVLVSED